jgi:RNA polymerase sigma-70 factor (ECF subfamily)
MTTERPERDTVIALAKQLCAASAGGVAGLLDPDAVLVVDNGGEPARGVGAAGRLAVADELTRIVACAPGRTITVAGLNGGLGIVVYSHDDVVGIVVPRVAEGAVDRLWAVVNPDKLTGWRPSA